jgi:hypothetical protein
LARRRAQTISLVDLGKPANNAKNRIRPCLVRRAGHCVVARTLRIAADMRVARASHCPARRYHHFDRHKSFGREAIAKQIFAQGDD